MGKSSTYSQDSGQQVRFEEAGTTIASAEIEFGEAKSIHETILFQKGKAGLHAVNQTLQNQTAAIFHHLHLDKEGTTRCMRRFPWLATMTNSAEFEMVMGVVIVFNCITIGLEVHYCPPAESPRFDWFNDTESEACPRTFLSISENICTLIFLMEFFLRGVVHGFDYHVKNSSRILDASIVWITGVLLTWIIPIFIQSSDELRTLTALRAFRLLRVVHVVRNVEELKEVWLLLKALMDSVESMIATVVVMTFLNYFFAIVAVTMAGDSPKLRDVPAHEFFAGLDQTMFTLVQIVTSDAWASIVARPVMKAIPGMWIYFILYIIIGVFVLMNLITAVIVENALTLSKRSEEDKLARLEQCRQQEIRKLKDIFDSLDVDKDGTVSLTEFHAALTCRPDIVSKFKLLEFHDNEIPRLFSDLDDGDDELTTDEFITGLRLMHGPARSKDLIRVQKSIERLHRRMDAFMHRLDGAPGDVEQQASESENKIEKTTTTHLDSSGSESSMTLDCSMNYAGSKGATGTISEPTSMNVASRHSSMKSTSLTPSVARRSEGRKSVDSNESTERHSMVRGQSPADDIEGMRLPEKREPMEQGGDDWGGEGPTKENATKESFNDNATGGDGEVLVTVFEEIRKQLTNQINEVRIHISQVCSAEISRQQQLARLNSEGLLSGLVTKKPAILLPTAYEPDVQALIEHHIEEVKFQIANVVREELASQLRLLNGTSHEQSTHGSVESNSGQSPMDRKIQKVVGRQVESKRVLNVSPNVCTR